MDTAPDGGHSDSELPAVAIINGATHTGLTSETANERQDRRDRESRLWSHGLHQDQEFIQRGNFFLVAESLLVVAYSGILTKGLAAGTGGHASKLLLSARVISLFGLLLSIIWIYVSNFERKTVEYLMKRAR